MLRFALRVALVAFRVLLRVAAAEAVFLVLGRFAFPRLLVLPRLAAAFLVVERRRGFLLVPVTASAIALAALDNPSVAASMPDLAVSAIVPRTPSFSFHAVHLPCVSSV